MSLLAEDRALLDAFRRGDLDALSRVYLHYADEVAGMLVRGFSFSGGGESCRFHGYASRFELEDALHEVFARALTEKARLGYDGLRPYYAYLFGIARAVVIDDFRSRERVLRRFTVTKAVESTPAPLSDAASDPIEGLSAPTGDPLRDLENAELVGLVQGFRRELNPSEAEVFHLRFAEGKSLAEVEAATGRSPSKVKTLERKLRHRLLERIWRSGYLRDWRPQEKSEGWFARTLRSLERIEGRPSK